MATDKVDFEDDIQHSMPWGMIEEMDAQVRRMLHIEENSRWVVIIPAIKLVREFTGWSLVESKNFVDAIKDDMFVFVPKQEWLTLADQGRYERRVK